MGSWLCRDGNVLARMRAAATIAIGERGCVSFFPSFVLMVASPFFKLFVLHGFEISAERADEENNNG